jgi:1-phosphatidylinositol phosphodiesterase
MKNTTTAKNWMSNLDGNTTIDKLSIPGTHDSGTSDLKKIIDKGPAHTQNFNIITQLNDGIRFLDIRVMHKEGRPADPLQIYHGAIECQISFGNVLDACTKFLKENTQETIIMLINAASGNGKDIQQYFDVYLQQPQYQSLFNLESVPPTLAKLRGKVVLFRRFPGDMGVDLSFDWYNTTFPVTNPEAVKFKIEDQYNQHDTKKKLCDVETMIRSAINNPNDGVIYITFNSISQGGHTPYQYAWGGGLGRVNPKMNPGLESYLKSDSGTNRFGVIMLDFYNNENGNINNNNTKLIINSNLGVELSA